MENTQCRHGGSHLRKQRHVFISSWTSGCAQHRHPASITEPLKNQRGFALVVFLSLAPALLIGFFATWGIQWFVRQKEILELHCERHTLQAQSALLEGARGIVALNPEIKALVLQKKALELAIKISPPAVKVAQLAQLKIVRLQLFRLKLKQKTLLMTSEARALAQLTVLTRSVEQAVRSLNRSRSSLGMTSPLLSSVLFKAPRVELETKPADATINYYHYPLRYSEQQKIGVTLKIFGDSIFPHWMSLQSRLHSRLPIRSWPVLWQEFCVSQPRKNGGAPWTSALAADSPLLNL